MKRFFVILSLVFVPYFCYGDKLRKFQETVNSLDGEILSAINRASVYVNEKDRCENAGASSKWFTIDRRCYVTEEQKTKSPYNAVVGIYGELYAETPICTGVIVKSDYNGRLYVYTAAHCVKNNDVDDTANIIFAKTQDGQTMTLEPLYISSAGDWAVYKIPEKQQNIPYVYVAEYSPEEPVDIIGYGSLSILNDAQIVDMRMVYKKYIGKIEDLFVKNPPEEVLNKFARETYVINNRDAKLKGSFSCYAKLTVNHASSDKTSCQIWQGNSGGPVFNADGKLVALVVKNFTTGYKITEYAETYEGGLVTDLPYKLEVTEAFDSKISYIIHEHDGGCYNNLGRQTQCYGLLRDSWRVTHDEKEYSGFAKCEMADNGGFVVYCVSDSKKFASTREKSIHVTEEECYKKASAHCAQTVLEELYSIANKQKPFD